MTRSRTAPALLALLLLTACGGGGDGGDLAGDEQSTVVAEKGADGQAVTVGSDDDPNRFVPERVEVAAGGSVTVTLTNSGGSPHDFVIEEVDGAKTEVIGEGEEATATFAVPDPGTYTFICTIHPGMDGELVVS